MTKHPRHHLRRSHAILLLALLPTPLPAAEWSSPTSGRWLDPANWSPSAVPTTPTAATINLPGTYTVTLDATTTTGPLTLDAPDATLLIDTAGAASLNFTPGTTLLSAGTLTINQLTTNASNIFTLPAGDTLTNHATITLTGTGGYSSPTVIRSAITGNVINTGTIQALDPAAGLPDALFRISGGAITNTGTITTGARSSLQFGGTINQNAGTLSGNFTSIASTFNHNGGTVNLVTFAPLSGTATLNFGASATNGTFAAGTGTLNLPNLTAGNTVYVTPGATVYLPTNTNNGHLLLNRPTPGTTVNPATPAAKLTLGSSGPFTNNGTLDLDNPDSPPATLPATFVNNGAVNVARAAGIDGTTPDKLRSLGTTWTNNGNLTVDAGAFARLAGATVSFTHNAGTLTTNDSLAVVGGNFYFNGGTTVGTVLLAENTLTIAPAAVGPAHFTLDPSELGNTLVGNIPAAVTLNLMPDAHALNPLIRASSTLTNAGAIRTDGVTLRPNLNLGTAGTLTNSGTLDGFNAALTNPYGVALSLLGSLTNTGSVTARSLTVRNTFTQNAGTLNVTDTLLISPNGTFNFNGGTLAGLPISLSAGTTLNISPSAGPANFSFLASGTLHATHLAPGSVLNLAPTSSTPAVVTADALTNEGSITLKLSSVLKSPTSLANPGTIDLQSTSSLLLLDYTDAPPLDDVRHQLLTHHLTSSTAPATQRLAYIDSALLSPAAAQALTLNQPLADPTTLIVKLTLTGDANVDGKLDPDDYVLLDQGFVTHASTWWQGDFNYDGVIDQSDYLLIDQSLYSQAQRFSPGFLAQRESQFGPAYVSSLIASVPEPSATVACLVAGLLPILTRRRSAEV